MPLPPINGSVYWIEADEEAAIFASGSQDKLCRRSFLSYLLLRLKVVAHPADFWQSSTSHKLIFDPQVQPLIQPVLQLHLGDSPTVVDYIADRTAKLRRDRASSRNGARELEQYTRHGTLITAQGAQLDGVFTNSGAVFPTSLSRDARFRELLIEDLLSDLPFGAHLGRCIREGLNRRDADTLIPRLVELAQDRRRFVSADGIVSRMRDAGCSRQSITKAYNRLQLLHWESRSDGHVSMPFVTRAKTGAIDPHDPDVFWTASDALLGPEFQKMLMALPWAKAVEVARDLQNDSVWAGYIETYHGIVKVVDESHDQIEESIVRTEVLKKHPGFWRILVGVRPDKWTVLSWTFHIASWMAGVPAGWALTWRIGSAGTTLIKMYDHATKVKKAYHVSDLHLLRTRILKMIEDSKTAY